MREQHGSADVATKLVLMKVFEESAGHAFGIEEPAAAPVLPGASMKLVGAGLGDDIDRSTESLAKLSRVGVRQHAHLLDIVRDRSDRLRSGDRFIIVDAV